jgi:hypothetical protein
MRGTRSVRERERKSDAGGVAILAGVYGLQNEFVGSVGTDGHTVPIEQKLEDLKIGLKA